MGELVWGRLFPSFLEGSTYLDEEEALKQGYDFEANRRFFHPLGLCLVTQVTDEGLRFLYVGMTRAKDRLILTYTGQRGGRPAGSHAFLNEIGLIPSPVGR